MVDLTFERLREVLDYDATTGIFTWRVHRGRFCCAGMRAGAVQWSGYRVIYIDGKTYYAARLAVFWMTGEWPPRDVDHLNGILDDNRWTNLRKATESQNCANARMHKNKQIPFKGVSRDRKRYRAQIMVNYQRIGLGSFDTPEEAHAAYIAAARHHFGEYARSE
jgi:hypothetical protein